MIYTETEILIIAIEKMYGLLDEFLNDCMDENQKPKAPSYKSLMKIRDYLPSNYKNSAVQKK